MKFRNTFFSYTLVLLIMLYVGTAYVRFFVIDDYVVAYEGDCDPTEHDCYIGCEDEECIEKYYYFHVKKYAPDLFAQCGADITGCENAQVCFPGNERLCTITYCDTKHEYELCEQVPNSNSVQKAIDAQYFGGEYDPI